MGLVCPICKEEGLKSKVRFIGHRDTNDSSSNTKQEQLWDYDEDGHVIERMINVKIECDRGHQTEAQLHGQLDKAEQL